MAEPLIELDTHNEQTSAATYDLAIINGGTVDTNISLEFGGNDSASNSITNVQLNATDIDKWADDLWYVTSIAADDQIHDETMTPDAVSANQAYSHFRLSSDAVSFASAPIITAYDGVGVRTNAEEPLAGTTNHVATFVKIVGGTSSAQPAQYWGEASSAALHDLETAGSVTLGAAAQGLNGDTSYITCTSADINTTPQYFSLALSCPNDATTGATAVALALSIKYTYT